jgi:hypothetical protein
MQTVETDPRWKLAEHLIASLGLAKSTRLSSLLLHIIKQSLEGHEGELTEQLIGERVFGRRVGYYARDDNIVRVHASRLRQRLEVYYRDEGKDEPLRITIPRGSYIPLFERVLPPPVVHESLTPAIPEQEDSSEKPPSKGWRMSKLWSGFFLGICCCLCLLVVLRFTQRIWLYSQNRPLSPTERLWFTLFSKSSDTLIVPADSGLVILKSFTKHSVSPADYASGRYLSELTCNAPCDSQFLETLAAHRYTSLADLQFAVELSRVPELLTSRVVIRYARDLQLDDLKRANLVMIGSLEADPRIQFFQDQMNFVLHDDSYQGPLRIENRNPMRGEQAVYLYSRNDALHSGYALIAFIPNLNGTGNVLIVQGFTLADTQAAADFVTNHYDFDALFAPVVASRHELPHFEVLLRTTDVNGFGGQPTVIAYRIY